MSAGENMNDPRLAILIDKMAPLFARPDPPEKWNFEDDSERREAIETEAQRRAEMVESIASIFRPPEPDEPPEPIDLRPLSQALDRLAKAVEGFELQDPPRPAPPPQKPGLGMDWLARIFAWLISAVLITFIYLTEFHPSYLIDLIRAWRG